MNILQTQTSQKGTKMLCNITTTDHSDMKTYIDVIYSNSVYSELNSNVYLPSDSGKTVTDLPPDPFDDIELSETLTELHTDRIRSLKSGR